MSSLRIKVSLPKSPHLSRITQSVEPAWPPRLHEVVDRPDRRISRIERAWGYLRRPKFRGSLVRAGLFLARDRFAAAIVDLKMRFRAEPAIVWLQDGTGGEDALSSLRSLALYVHYSPSGHVSEMVHDQIDAYRRLGFTVLFITMAPELTADAITRLSRSCALIVRRRNHGLDFGAWHDLVPIIRTRAPRLEEMLLVNDSICGPLRPLEPVLGEFRAAGNGLFGLSENLAPRPHLQSYFLLLRGANAIADALSFLNAFQPSGDKRRTIRKGEVAFTVWMRRRGHAVAALCGYDRVERTALGHAVARERVRILYPWRFAGIAADVASDPDVMCRALRKSPLNATHLFWRELVEDFGLPFVKTDLLLRNPLGISDPLDWRSVVPQDGDRVLQLHITDHLGQFDPAIDSSQRGVAAKWRGSVAIIAGSITAELRYRRARFGGVTPAGRKSLVSVILPVRDRPGPLLEAITSALAQLWPHFELLIVDDGSADDVAALVSRRFKDDRIRVLRQAPIGVSAARNLGLRHARGELIAYLDSDNLWHPGYLAGMVRAFDRRPTLDCAYAMLITSSHGRRQVLWEPYDRATLEQANFIDLNVFAHRRTVFDLRGGFDEGLSRLVDWDVVLRYTAQQSPARLAIWGATYRVLDVGHRISDVVPLAESIAKIRRKLYSLSSAAELPKTGPNGMETFGDETMTEPGGF